MQHPTALVAASTRASDGAAGRPEALACENVSRWFGGLQALKSVSIRVGQGEIFGLVGPNGSGKTTLVNAITGFYPPQEGSIRLHGDRIEGTRPHRVARMGVARTFQNVALFPGLTVLDNVRVGAHTEGKVGFGLGLLGLGRSENKRMAAEAKGLLERLDLAHLAGRPAAGRSPR